MSLPLVRRFRVLRGALLLGVAGLLLAAGPAAADEPTGRPGPPLAADDLGLDGHGSWAERVRVPSAPRIAPTVARPTPQPSATPPPTPAPMATSEPSVPGIDVSYPQCGRTLPDEFGFAVVGVNGGRVYSANPCLAGGDAGGQLAWAGDGVELYVNTGNPGPRDSRYWPVGQDEPRPCAADDADSVDCAYTYGWNAARYAYAVALEAYAGLGWTEPDAAALPEGITWWLDVEDANSWRRDHERNVAALEGMVDALEALDAGTVGFYSTPRLWDRITGGTDAFAGHPAWHAGASDEADALARCASEEAFTGGPLHMVQWVEDGLDRNVRCDS